MPSRLLLQYAIGFFDQTFYGVAFFRSRLKFERLEYLLQYRDLLLGFLQVLLGSLP